MELVQEMVIKTNKFSNERTESFQKIENVIFCKKCGKEHEENRIQNSENKCNICNGNDFIKGNFASTLAGYIRLDKIGRLKTYYKERTRRTSGARMNTRRMVIWLLVKDGYVLPGDKKTQDTIYKCLWKRW